MHKILSTALKEFFSLYSNRLLLFVVLILAISYAFLVYLIFVEFLGNYLSHFSLGALIIRTKGLESYASLLPYFVISPLVTIASFLSPALLYVYFAILTVKKKLGRRMNAKELKEKSIMSFLFFIAFYTLLSLLTALLSPLLILSSPLYSLALLVIFYSSFFIPYALIIDDYSWKGAVKKGFEVLIRKPLEPLAWAFIIAFLLVFSYLLVSSFTSLFFPNGLGVDRPMLNDLVMFLINQILILPFGILLAAHMYVSRYPLVRV